MDTQDWRQVRPAEDRAVFQYRSPALGDELQVTVVPPLTPPIGNSRLPVLYVLDPFLTLDTVVGWARVYARYAEGEVPSAFIVGVGHPTEVESRFMALRIRDLTPTPVTGREWRPPLGAGQGPRLLRAFHDEIVPFVEANYPVSADRTVIGWSLGGLFALYALFHQPHVFSRYLVVSPSLWWENRLPLEWEREWARHHSDLAARVFLAVGAREEAPGGGWLSEGFSDEIIGWFRQVSNFRTFVRRLKSRGYPNLELESVIFSGEYHMTVYPAAIARGLVSLFRKNVAR